MRATAQVLIYLNVEKALKGMDFLISFHLLVSLRVLFFAPIQSQVCSSRRCKFSLLSRVSLLSSPIKLRLRCMVVQNASSKKSSDFNSHSPML